jgi:hypothetical protein
MQTGTEIAGRVEGLPMLIEKAAAALASASTAAEVLEAKTSAKVAYEAAKLAAQLARQKDAHDTVMAACPRCMGDALVIEAQAMCLLADQYDAVQERGEVAKPGQQDRVRDNIQNTILSPLPKTSALPACWFTRLASCVTPRSGSRASFAGRSTRGCGPTRRRRELK